MLLGPCYIWSLSYVLSHARTQGPAWWKQKVGKEEIDNFLLTETILMTRGTRLIDCWWLRQTISRCGGRKKSLGTRMLQRIMRIVDIFLKRGHGSVDALGNQNWNFPRYHVGVYKDLYEVGSCSLFISPLLFHLRAPPIRPHPSDHTHPTTPNLLQSPFSQPFKNKCKSKAVKIGSIIIFHLSKQWNAKFSILCDAIFLVRLQGKFEIDHSWEWEG